MTVRGLLRLLVVLAAFAASPQLAAEPLLLGPPEGSVSIAQDPLIRAELDALRNLLSTYADAPDDAAAGAVAQELKLRLREADQRIADAHGPTTRRMALYLAATLSEMDVAEGSEAAIRRGERAAAIERQLSANADFYGRYFVDRQLESILGKDTEALATFLQFLMGRAEDERGTAIAEKLARKAFEMAQLAFISEGARAATSRLRLDPSRPPAELTAAQYVRESMRTIWATTWLKLYLKAGAFDGPDMSFRTEAEKNVEAYTATIDQAVWLFRDRAISIPDILYPRALTATEAAAALGTDEVLFVAVPGDTFVHSFAITRDGFSWSTTAVSWSEVWDNVQDLRRNLGVPDGRGLGQETGGNETPAGGVSGASWLYDTLLKPHEALLKNKRRLLVSATNAAARIPFEMLLATPPEPDQDFPEMDWLVKHHSVLALPSVELLLGRKPTPRRDAIYYFGVGNPDYKAVANSRYKSAVMRMIESLTPLPDSAGEVQDLAAVFGKDKGLAVTGATANEQLLEESSAEGILNRFTILHFATHGMAAGDHEDALQPLLALSPPPYPLPDVANTVDKLLAVERDGALTASEISGLKIAAKLVILSACNSATPEPFERDGQGGLSAAFMAAGAEDVLATHWPVNSRAAVEIVTGMMKADPGLEDLPAALQTSLTAMIAKGGPEAHPRYWAPFSLIGFP